VPRGAKSLTRRTETPKPIWIKFCTVVDITDIVTYTNVGDHRLRGFWTSVGQISSYPMDFRRRPYNTLRLPCECVIWRNDRDHQMVIAGGPSRRLTNPRWRTAAILKKNPSNHHISATVRPILMKFSTMMHIGPGTGWTVKIWNFWKICYLHDNN